MVDDVVVGIEDAVGQPVVAHELPDVLDRIELGRAWRQGENSGPIQEKWRRPTPFALLLPRI